MLSELAEQQGFLAPRISFKLCCCEQRNLGEGSTRWLSGCLQILKDALYFLEVEIPAPPRKARQRATPKLFGQTKTRRPPCLTNGLVSCPLIIDASISFGGMTNALPILLEKGHRLLLYKKEQPARRKSVEGRGGRRRGGKNRKCKREKSNRINK